MCSRVALPAALLALAQGGDLFLPAVQNIYVIRHGDKYSSYPDCATVSPGEDCFNATLMGDNAPLTSCGRRHAEYVAKKLAGSGIKQLVVGPYARTLQTSLPLAAALDLKIKVEHALSEARQPEGPYQPLNALLLEEEELREIEKRWDLDYGSVPIPTPETDELYVQRVRKAAATLSRRFPPSSGDVAFVTHATTSFSVVYGLCFGNSGTDADLENFVNNQIGCGPGSVIHVVRDSQGRCQISQTDNSALESLGCGKTQINKCEIADFPDWYWAHAAGHGAGNCA